MVLVLTGLRSGLKSHQQVYWLNLILLWREISISLYHQLRFGETQLYLILQFKYIIQLNNLVYLLPATVVPTWRNGRTGSDSIMKQLEHLFLSDNLLQHSDRYRTWVEYSSISDHAPVILQLDSYSHCSTYPFMFNPCWLWNFDFERLVTEVWTDQSYDHEVNVQRRLAWKLKDLK